MDGGKSALSAREHGIRLATTSAILILPIDSTVDLRVVGQTHSFDAISV